MGICSSSTNSSNSSSVVPHSANLRGENVQTALDNNSADGTDEGAQIFTEVMPLSSVTSVDDTMDRESSQQNRALQLLQQQQSDTVSCNGIINGSVNHGRALPTLSEISESSALLPNHIPSDTSDDESNHLNVQNKGKTQPVVLPYSSLTTQNDNDKAASVVLSITSIASLPTSPVYTAIISTASTYSTTTTATSTAVTAASTVTKAAVAADIPKPLTPFLPPIIFPAKEPQPLVPPIFHNQYGSTRSPDGSQNKTFAEVSNEGGFMILPPVSTSISSSPATPAFSSITTTTTTTTTTAATTSANDITEVVPSSPPPLPPFTPKQQPQPAIPHLLHHHLHHRRSRSRSGSSSSSSGSHPASNTEFAGALVSATLLPSRTSRTAAIMGSSCVSCATAVETSIAVQVVKGGQSVLDEPSLAGLMDDVNNNVDNAGRHRHHVAVSGSLSMISSSDDDYDDNYSGDHFEDEDQDSASVLTSSPSISLLIAASSTHHDLEAASPPSVTLVSPVSSSTTTAVTAATATATINVQANSFPTPLPPITPITPRPPRQPHHQLHQRRGRSHYTRDCEFVAGGIAAGTAGEPANYDGVNGVVVVPVGVVGAPEQQQVLVASFEANKATAEEGVEGKLEVVSAVGTVAGGGGASGACHPIINANLLQGNKGNKMGDNAVDVADDIDDRYFNTSRYSRYSRYPLQDPVADPAAALPPRRSVDEVQVADEQNADGGTIAMLQTIRTETKEAAGSSSCSHSTAVDDDLQWHNRQSSYQIIFDQKIDPATCWQTNWASSSAVSNYDADEADDGDCGYCGDSNCYNCAVVAVEGSSLHEIDRSQCNNSRQQLQRPLQLLPQQQKDPSDCADRVLKYLSNNEGAYIGLRGKLRLLGGQHIPTMTIPTATTARTATGTTMLAASLSSNAVGCHAITCVDDGGSQQIIADDEHQRPHGGSSSINSIAEPLVHVAVLIRRQPSCGTQPDSSSRQQTRRKDLLTKLMHAWSHVTHVFSIRSNALLPYCGPAIEFRREASIFDLQAGHQQSYQQRDNVQHDEVSAMSASVASATSAGQTDEDSRERIERMTIKLLHQQKRKKDEYLLLQAFPLPLGSRTLFDYCLPTELPESKPSAKPSSVLSAVAASSTASAAAGSTGSTGRSPSAFLNLQKDAGNIPMILQAISFGRKSLCALQELHNASWVHGKISPHSCLILPGKTLREAVFAPVEVPFAAAAEKKAGGLHAVGIADAAAGYIPLNAIPDSVIDVIDDDGEGKRLHTAGATATTAAAVLSASSSSIISGNDKNVNDAAMYAMAFDIRCWAVTLAFACWPPLAKETCDAWSHFYSKKDFKGMMGVSTESHSNGGISFAGVSSLTAITAKGSSGDKSGLDGRNSIMAVRTAPMIALRTLRTSSLEQNQEALMSIMSAESIFLKPLELAMQCVLQVAAASLGHTAANSTNSDYSNAPITPTAHQLLRLSLFNTERSGLWTSEDGLLDFILCWCNKWNELNFQSLLPEDKKKRFQEYKRYFWSSITGTWIDNDLVKTHEKFWNAATIVHGKTKDYSSGSDDVWSLLRFIRNTLTHANGSASLADAAKEALITLGLADDTAASDTGYNRNDPAYASYRQRDVFRFVLWRWPCLPYIIMIEQGWEDSELLQSPGGDSLLTQLASNDVHEAIIGWLKINFPHSPLLPRQPRPPSGYSGTAPLVPLAPPLLSNPLVAMITNSTTEQSSSSTTMRTSQIKSIDEIFKNGFASSSNCDMHYNGDRSRQRPAHHGSRRRHIKYQPSGAGKERQQAQTKAGGAYLQLYDEILKVLEESRQGDDGWVYLRELGRRLQHWSRNNKDGHTLHKWIKENMNRTVEVCTRQLPGPGLHYFVRLVMR